MNLVRIDIQAYTIKNNHVSMYRAFTHDAPKNENIHVYTGLSTCIPLLESDASL
jgi:hypothetical protein